MKEIWKDIDGYEGYYQVSNLGRVKSLDRYREFNNKKYKVKGRILKSCLDGKKRYLHVYLCKNGVNKMAQIHSLVAKHFVKGYKEGLEVDHIDCDTKNNICTNLRWVTRKENMSNPITYKKIINNHVNNQRIPVIGINMVSGYILTFDYVRQAKAYGFKGIGENIHGRAKHCKGFIWRYADEI